MIKIIRCADQEIATHLADVDVLIPMLTPISSGVIARCPRLKLIMQFGCDLSRVETDAARVAGVNVSRISSSDCGIAESAAEYAILLALRLIRLPRDPQYSQSELQCGFPLRKTLCGMNAVVIGHGPFGRCVSDRIRGMGCDVKIITLSRPENYEFFPETDIIFLCCPLTQKSKHMVNTEFISAMKPGVFLINMSQVCFALFIY